MADKKTNNTEDVETVFKALTSGEYENFALYSCFVNEEPTAAICAVNHTNEGGFAITPLFVAVTPGMELVDHDGRTPDKMEVQLLRKRLNLNDVPQA